MKMSRRVFLGGAAAAAVSGIVRGAVSAEQTVPPPPAARAPRPFTIEDALRTESVLNGRFDPTGRYFIFARVLPKGDRARYDVFAPDGVNLCVVDLSSPAPNIKTIATLQGSSTYFSLSPDGRRVAFASRVLAPEAEPSLLVADLASGSVQRYDTQAGLEPRDLMAHDWLSNDKLLYCGVPDGPQARSQQGLYNPTAAYAAAWQTMSEGKEATASPVGSGRHIQPRVRQIKANTESRTHVLAHGDFTQWRLSPDNRHLALTRNDPPFILDRNIEAWTRVPGRHSVILLDMRSDHLGQPLLRDHDVWPPTLQWSSDGRYLLFYARRNDVAWSEGAFYVYDRDTAATVMLPGQDVIARVTTTRVSISQSNRLTPRAGWVGNTVVFQGAENTWHFARPQGRVAAIDMMVDGEPGSVVAASDAGLIVRSSEGFWRIALDNSRTSLLQFKTAAEVWSASERSSDYVKSNVPQMDKLIVHLRSSHDSVAIVDVKNGTTQEITIPDAAVDVLAVSAETRSIAYVAHKDGIQTLKIVRGKSAPRALLRLNQHRAGIAFGESILLRHTDPKGRPLTSWLMLPPGYDGRSKLPAVVEVYAGTTYAADRPPRAPWGEANQSNTRQHLITGHGYALLLPSIPFIPVVPSDPMDGLADIVLSAVDAAVATGYVDSERLAVQGYSTGGYTCAAVISQTSRFKAAVAGAGYYNLTSHWGTFGRDWEFAAETNGIDVNRPIAAVESRDNRMGGPPWSDPNRYVRNSPYFHAAAITTPLMLIHGDLDFVPITQAEEMFMALVRQNKDAILLRYWGEGHGFESPANLRDQWRRIFAWYEEYIGQPYPVAEALSVN